MTNEERQLLLQDLCARLPYGVIVRYKSMKGEGTVKLGYDNITYVSALGRGWWTECKPYLRPMSSMTEEEFSTINVRSCLMPPCDNGVRIVNYGQLSFLNSHHFDYRGLIEKGLALPATEDMYKN